MSAILGVLAIIFVPLIAMAIGLALLADGVDKINKALASAKRPRR